MGSKWDELQASVVPFQTESLLKQAFTHTSYRNEHKRPSMQDNERLEFLGDAVLELVVSEHLYRTKPQMPEGELTRFRAAIVCEATLSHFAQRLRFDQYVRLGRGEERSGGRQRPALLADLFEAFIGALYLDQGLKAVSLFLSEQVFAHLDAYSMAPDHKTALQEWVQQHVGQQLRYEIVEERGPAHAREFTVQVIVGKDVMGTGLGKSKKEAEQRAAQEALEHLRKDNSGEA